MITPTPRSLLVRDSQPRTPSSAYAHCDECGTSAGESCYDSRDRPCSPCAGRVLASTGSLDRAVRRAYKKRKREPVPVPEPPPPPVIEVATPAPIPCWYCGVSIPLMGGHRGRDWVPCCTSPECRRGRKREHARRRYAVEAANASPPPTVACWHCGHRCPCRDGRQPDSAYPCCGQRACLQAIMSVRNASRVRESRAAPTATFPCWWCGVAIVSSFRRHGRNAAHPCCGSTECKREIAHARQNSLPKAMKQKQQSDA